MSHRVLRIKHRYVAVKCYPEKTIDTEKIYRTIEDTFRRLFGEVYLVDSRLRRVNVRKVSEKNIIMSCRHAYLGKVLAAITLINRVNGEEVALDVVAVSGTLKTLKRKILLHSS